jgi:hypothetical protein
MTDVCVLIAGRPGDEGARGLEGRGVYPHASIWLALACVEMTNVVLLLLMLSSI